jgi:hypothetical protein
MSRLGPFTLTAMLLGSAIGCSGSIGEALAPGTAPGDPSQPARPATPGQPGPGGQPSMPGQPGAPTTPVPPGGAPGVAPGDPNAVGQIALRRLDRREYNNTVRDLLGDTTRPADRFPSDKGEFLFRVAGPVSSQDYSTLRDAAEALATGANVGMLAPCTGGDEEACARTFITGFGLRAYRRPLVPREVDSLVQLYKEGRGPVGLDHAGAIRLVIEGILQAPAFVYHWESGPDAPKLEGPLVKLSHYENAAQLSYFLWGTMPDQDLFDAAAAGKLGTQGELEAQARRMLDSPKARDTVAAFFEEWLGLDQVLERPKNPMVYPQFKDDLKAAMLDEARSFVGSVVFDGDSLLTTVLTAGFSFVNQPLAGVYGVKGVTGAALKQMPLDAAQRAGLLTQTAFLTVTGATDGSHPVKRGKKLFENLLCGELPPPPAEVPPPKEASEGGTTRERFAEHSAQACATGCHGLMDPLGFAFEHYDGIGGFRTMDNGGVVDASGSVELDGQKHAFKDARDLVKVLAASATAQRCFATQWTRFALKRKDGEADRPSLDAIAGAFRGGNIRDLLVGVTGSRSFRYRAPAQGEILQ